ncbi:MAG: hypothetical protein NTZ74_16310 [Chloroflexi bacterium]|nr:hypothetical protein [Chloroflexota bacterium]
MSTKIMIPAGIIHGLKKTPLVLDFPMRCSRCDVEPAEYLETHRLKFRVGYQKTHLYGKKYHLTSNYLLKIRVCESCYLSDYLTHPETLDRDETPQGRIARIHTTSWTLGSLLSAAGFLLLTPIIPEIPAFQLIKTLWQIPVILGVLTLLLTWLSQRKQQILVLKKLEKYEKDLKTYARAEVRTPILSDINDMDAIAVEIRLDNDRWATETADFHLWSAEAFTPTIEKSK